MEYMWNISTGLRFVTAVYDEAFTKYNSFWDSHEKRVLGI